MAVNDKSIEMLAKSVEDLVKSMNGKNSFGSGQSSQRVTRMGRGGSSNGKSSGDYIVALADNLEELHKSMKSGGVSLADHFTKMIKNINPLNAAFDKLEDAIRESALTQTESYTKSAKSMLAYIKSVEGNVSSIKKVTSEYNELTDNLKDIVDNHDTYIKDQVSFQKKLKKIEDLRLKLEGKDSNGKFIGGGITGGRPLLDGQLASYLRLAAKNPKIPITKAASAGVSNMIQGQSAVNGVSESYLKEMTTKMKAANDNFIAATTNLAKAIGAGLLKDVGTLPSFITNRIKQGFASNEFMQAFSLGVSAQELNDMRSANRDVFNALQGFSSQVDLVKDGTLAEWADQSKKVGLIGKEALVFTQNMMRSAYDTGRKFDTELNNKLTRDAQVIQQAFGGSIEESAKMIQDYSGTMYNVSRFAMAGNKQEEEVIQKELTMRMLHTKYMGFELEYMKQQQQMQHNSAMGDIVDRFRSGIMSEVSAKMVSDKTGMSITQARAMMAMNDSSGREITDPKLIQAAQEGQIQYAKYVTSRNKSVANSLDPSNLGSLLDLAPLDAVMGKSGFNKQSVVDAGMGAAARNKVRGDISFNDYVSQMNEQADRTDASITAFEKAVMEFSESVGGVKGMPGAGMMGAILGFGGGFLKGVVGRKIMGMAGKRLFPTATRTAGKGAADILARSSIKGETSALKSGGILAKLGLGGVGAKLGSKAGEEILIKAGGKSLLKKIPIAGLIAGLAFAAGRAKGGDLLGAAGEVGSGLVSTVPIVGTAASVAIDAGLAGRDIAKTQMTKKQSDIMDTALMMLASPGVGFSQLTSDYMMRKASNTSAGIAPALDSAGLIKRDAEGNAIDANGKPIELSLLEELVDLTKKQLNVAEEDSISSRMKDEKQDAIAAQRSSVKEHMENLASTYRAKFTVG